MSVTSILGKLRYDLREIKALPPRPSWCFFEYKFHTLSGGIAVLENLLQSIPVDHREPVQNLLAEYRKTFNTIL